VISSKIIESGHFCMISKENPAPRESLGIDIGGTGMKAAPVHIAEGQLLAKSIKMATPRPPTPDTMLPVIKDLIGHFQWKGDVGVGFPGVVKKGKVLTAPNLSKEWEGVDAKVKIQELASSATVVINDADAAALAEMRFGAGKPYHKHGGGVVMVITLGTGIGSALFVDGHLVPNLEMGHMEMDGMEAEKRAATVIREREGLSWEEWGARVNKYLQTLEMLFSPDFFIIGGGVSESCEKFFPYLKVQAKIVPAEMGNDAGIVGAAIAFSEFQS
jgi:polyphosphate glucokinase